MAAQAKWVVMKFGGTSVSSAERWHEIAAQVKARCADGHPVMVVVSAISGVTDALQQFIDTADVAQALAVFELVQQRQQALADQLGIDAGSQHQAALDQLKALLQHPDVGTKPAHQASILASGELLSSLLGAAALQAMGVMVQWQDARGILRAQASTSGSQRSRYLSTTCVHQLDADLAQRLATDGQAHITQGFIAANQAGETVLLGRGGSDTTAAYLAAILDAVRLEIWTDVPGMFSANPRLLPSARLLRQLSYQEAQELASMGARVLHPRSIGPVREHRIPLHVRQTSRADIDGTVISSYGSDYGAQVKAIVHRKGITLIAMEGVAMWHQVGFLADAFAVFKRHGLSIDLVSTSEANVTVSLDLAEHLLDPDTMAALLADLAPICRARVIPNCASISLVGQGIRMILHRLGPALEVFEQRRIYLLSQASNDLNLTFVVDEKDADKLVQQLHRQLIPGGLGGDSVFGHTWAQLFGQDQAFNLPIPWWRQQAAALLELMQERDAAFVYCRAEMRRHAQALLALRHIDRVFFAMKANPNAVALREFVGQGLGIECVSIQEVRHALKQVPGLTPERILFTPNFAPREEYREGLKLGVRVTIDNIYVLEHWGEDFSGQDVFVRVDTGSGLGHHKLVRTAGVNSKFGVPEAELPALAELAKRHRVQVVGLHAHTGSGVMHTGGWLRTFSVLGQHLSQFPEVRVVDIGGGFGVPDKADELPFDIAALDQALGELRAGLPTEIELWAEPGRYLVAPTGVLLARVTQVKGKGEVQYVGVATGMNSLIRPALYGAYHDIYNLSRLECPGRQVSNVVGPICETGDILGLDRLLPECREGDVLLIANVGAYGATMASRYNLREPAAECFID